MVNACAAPGLSETIQATEQLVKAYLEEHKQDASHDFSHIQRVKANALRLVAMEQARDHTETINERVVAVTSLVHDVGDFKYTKSLEIQKQHISTVLEQIPGLTPEDKVQIFDIVSNMSFRKELEGSSVKPPVCSTIEFMIVQDADRLDAIGAAGLARCFAYAGATGGVISHFTDPDSYVAEKPTAEQYNSAAVKPKGGDAIGHVYEKLLHLSAMMKTDSGRKLAAQRHEFMVSYLNQFWNEVSVKNC